MKSKLLPIIGVCMAALFIYLGLDDKAQRAELAEKGKSAAGEIVSASTRTGSKNKKKYYLTVRWDDNGTPRSHEFQVKNSFYTSHASGNQVTNKSATVLYIPGTTDKAIIEGGSTGFAGMEWLGYVVAGVSLLWGFFVFTRR